MKVIQINCVYPNGSTGKIVSEIHQSLLRQGHESIVCYGRGKHVSDSNVIKTCTEFQGKFNNVFSRLSGLVYGGCPLSTFNLIQILKREKPDIVHLHCINGFFVNIYRLVEWLKTHNISTVLTLHAEFMYTANCSHAFECDQWKQGCRKCPELKRATKSLWLDRTSESYSKMKNAFSGFGPSLCVVSVSPWVKQRALQSSILCDFRHEVVLNGVNTHVFHKMDATGLKEKHHLTDEKILFHVSAHFSDEAKHDKGGWAVIELAKRLSDVNVKVFVAAQRCSISSDLPENMVLLGTISDQSVLAEYYSLANVTVIASRKETFSMPCAESLCCGTPVAGFEAGAPEMIALRDFSSFVEYGRMDLLEETVREMLKNTYQRDKISSEAKDKYAVERMVDEYMNIYGGYYEI